MKLRSVQTRQFGNKEQYDLVVAAAGWEPRSTAILSSREWSSVERRVVLGFQSLGLDELSRRHREEFEAGGFTLLECDGSDAGDIRAAVGGVLSGGEVAHIFVDISSMTRVWYAEIVKILRDEVEGKAVQVDFGYFPGVYPDNLVQPTPNEFFGPLGGFVGFEPPMLPIALILGLGYDVSRADSVVQRLEPKRVRVFSVASALTPDQRPEIDERYRFPVGSIEFYRFALHDPGATFHALESMASGLERGFRTIGCSLGPKLFGLLLMLVGTVRPRLSVWRVSSGGHQEITLVEARTRAPFVCSTFWESDD